MLRSTRIVNVNNQFLGHLYKCTERAFALPWALAFVASGLAICQSFMLKFLYMIGKVLLAKLICTRTGLVTFILYIFIVAILYWVHLFVQSDNSQVL